MTPTTIQKIKDKTGYNLEAFTQAVITDYRNLMSYNQIGRKYNVSHKLIGEILQLGGVTRRHRLDAIRLSYEQRMGIV